MTRRRGADAPLRGRLSRSWIAFRDLLLDHHQQGLRQRPLGIEDTKAEAHLIEQPEKLRIGLSRQIVFGHFEHGFLLLFAPPPVGRVAEEKSEPMNEVHSDEAQRQ